VAFGATECRVDATAVGEPVIEGPDPTAILIPAMRPQHFARLVDNIAETTPEPHNVYWAIGTDVAADELARLKQDYWKDDGASWGVRLNFMYHHTTEPYLFLCADDVKFHDGWLTAAHRCMTGIDGVVMVNDLHNPRGTLALVSRHYLDTESGCVDVPGVVCCPFYRHTYVDDELRDVAQSRNRYAYCPESVVEHLHPAAGKGEWDDVYAVGAQSVASDSALYRSRMHLWGGA
jgi:hypothetical protein